MGCELNLQAQFAFKLFRTVRSPTLKCIFFIIHFAVSKKNSNVPSFMLIPALASVKFTVTCCHWRHVKKTTLWQFNKHFPRLTVSLAHPCTCSLYMFWAPIAAFIAVCVYVTVMACRETFWGMAHNSSSFFFFLQSLDLFCWSMSQKMELIWAAWLTRFRLN